MNRWLLFLYIVPLLWAFTGCEVPPQSGSIPENSPLDNLKLSDLKDVTAEQVNVDSLMNFRVLTYLIDPGNVETLDNVYSHLSQTDVRVVNKEAFRSNGFMVGIAPVNERVAVPRELARIGAVRTAQANLMMPPDQTEAMSSVPLQVPEAFNYALSEDNSTTLTLGPGFLGWVMSAKPDPRYRRSALVKIFPAYWQPGIEDIRLRMGLDPIDYQPIPAGEVLMRVEERGVIVLGPVREMSDSKTLDRKLFFLPGRNPKIRFFVIICDSAGL